MKVVIIGQGGHSKVIHDLVSSNQDMEVIGYLDDKYNNFNNIDGMYVGPIKSTKKLVEYFEDIKFVVGIGDNHIRKSIVQRMALPNEKYMTIVHPTACFSPSAQIGCGSVIMPNAVINASTRIGHHSIINTGSVIEHDNHIDNFVHISPNATLTGSVQIEEGVHVGAGATIIPNVRIGEWSIIGAGATVINHIPANCTAVGTPAKVKMKEGDRLVQ
ncbi:acetyltransferase [Halalkalibacter alkalisediminis]|uniref:Acetyltransferase n=1 Tax=Halalkalibacter alkalisediminis TaxID=935616 RepID=A0ABV6NH25_9BACI|nr:acetyltransferase [Halalkalibacter alkalisediminis]